MALFRAPQYRDGCVFDTIPTSFVYGPLAGVYLACSVAVICCTLGLVRLARKHRIVKETKSKEDYLFTSNSKTKKGETVFCVAYNKSCRPNPVLNNNNKISTFHNNIKLTSKDEAVSEHAPVTLESIDITTMCPFERYNNKRTKALNGSSIVNGNVTDDQNNATTILENSDTSATSHAADVKDTASLPAKSSSDSAAPTGTDLTRSLRVPKSFSSTDDVKNRPCLCIFRNKKTTHNCWLNKANMKIVKFVLVVFGTFFVCTFPSLVLLSLLEVFKVPLFINSKVAFDAMHFLLVSNSGMNFLTITYMNKEFRKALVNTVPICKLCSRKKNDKK